MATMSAMQNTGYLPNATGNLTGQKGGAYTRTIDPNTETVAGQYGNLLKGSNPLVQRAIQKGKTMAQMRGSNGNDSLFAGASEDALAENLLPVAGADAAAYNQVGAQNQDALNQQNLQQMSNTTSKIVANIGAGASKYGSDKSLEADKLRLEENRRQFDQGMERDAANRLQDRSWNLADQETARKAAGRQAVAQQVLGTIFSDPSYWRDPQGASGMMRFFTEDFSNIWDSLFNDNGSP